MAPNWRLNINHLGFTFAILSLLNDLYWNIAHSLCHHLEWIYSKQCKSVCLNTEKMAPVANIFEISFPSGIDFHIVENIVERRLSLCYVSMVLPTAHDWTLAGNVRVIDTFIVCFCPINSFLSGFKRLDKMPKVSNLLETSQKNSGRLFKPCLWKCIKNEG